MATLLSKLFGRKLRKSSPSKPFRRTTVPLQLEALEDRLVPTVAFQPNLWGPESITYNGAPMSQPLASNAYAMKSPQVYLIFVGPAWKTNGSNIPAVNNIVAGAQSILASAYLSGLKQYGSDGHAVWGSSYVDTTLNPDGWHVSQSLGYPYYRYSLPKNSTGAYQTDNSNNYMYYETGRILANSAFSSWKSSGDGTTSPIYVVLGYTTPDGKGAGTGAGSNAFGLDPTQVDYTDWRNDADYYPGLVSPGVNCVQIDLAPPSASNPTSDVDMFTRTFSHEVAERMSTGTGNLAGNLGTTGIKAVSPAAPQISDGEPDQNQDFYTWRLNGQANGPLVEPYWSVLDQAFIAPDNSNQYIVLDPVVNGTSGGQVVSLQKGNLYLVSATGYSTAGKTSIDSGVEAYALYTLGGANHIFDLSAGGQVREYTPGAGPNGTNWTALTGGNTHAGALVGTKTGLYMQAYNDGGAEAVWQYNGAPGSWKQITGSTTTVYEIAAAGGAANGLFMRAYDSNYGYEGVWKYSGSPYAWGSPLTGSNTLVFHIAGSYGAISGAPPNVVQSAQSFGALYMLAYNTGSGLPDQAWQYTGSGWNNLNVVPSLGWSTQTKVMQIAMEGNLLYTVADDGNGGNYQVWQYQGVPGFWTDLTGSNTMVMAAGPLGANSITTDGTGLYMLASNDGGSHYQVWKYNTSGTGWTYLTSPSWNVQSFWFDAYGVMNIEMNGMTYQL
jgi:hypothetical protein